MTETDDFTEIEANEVRDEILLLLKATFGIALFMFIFTLIWSLLRV